jgi:glutamate racemase
MESINISHLPIGIFDSGFGGLSVMKAIAKTMPNEDILYLGDAARLPYGSKSPETIKAYTSQCAHWLCSQPVKLLIIACHTASSLALLHLQELLSIPVIGMVEPSLPVLKNFAHQGPVAILGTQATISSGIYQSFLANEGLENQLTTIACPLLAPLVEEGLIGSEIAKECIKHYLAPIKGRSTKAVLLGCTHYPLLKNDINNFLGSSCVIIDPADQCAQKAHETLQTYQMFSHSAHAGSYHFFTTDDPLKFKLMGQAFLGRDIPHAEKVFI